MTSDAKVGLLLGLVFIVIIAFLINGIPNLIGDKPQDGIITNSVAGTTSNWGPRDQAEEVVKTVGSMRQTPRAAPKMSMKTPNRNIALNPSPAIIKSGPVVVEPVQSQLVSQVQRSVAAQVPVQINVSEVLSKSSPRASRKIPSLVKAKATVYKVALNDNLTKIAVKFYGAKEGNKYANIKKIYEANKKVMPSMNAVRQGQSLVIPPLNGKAVKSAVRFTQKIKNAIRKPASSSSSSSKVYVVKDGDTLSRISARQLGNVKRYSEIVKLNKSLQKNEDLIYVGMKLNLPK